MGYTLDASHNDYLKITINGIIDKRTTVSAMSELMQHPEYTVKHSYWDCTNASLGLTIGDIKEIVGILRLYKPNVKGFANKSVFVVPGEFNKAMVDLFISMTKLLPWHYRVFKEHESAVKYLTSS